LLVLQKCAIRHISTFQGYLNDLFIYYFYIIHFLM
jgi:hypothetical protein